MLPRPPKHTGPARSAVRRHALRTAAALTATAALVALAGCSGTQGATTLDKSAKVTIQVWAGQADAAEKSIEALAKEFEKDHPNVTIDLSPGASSTDGLLQKLSA